MLTKAGETRVLSAKAFNSTGTEVFASFTWASSKPNAVSVDANGKLTAVTAVGSSQIIVSSGGMQSPPVLVTVVTPASGAVLIADEQVVSPPTLVNPDAEPDLTNEYEVVLRNLEPPAVGTILLGTGAAPIGGKVVSSTAVAGGVRVRLKLATVKEMVAKASFDEVMSFRGAPLNLPKAISDAYNVAQVGDEYTLTPKPAATSSGAARVRAQGEPQGTSVFTALPFNECTTNTPALPITLSALPTLSIKIDPTYELKTDEFGALERLVFKATPSLKATIPFIINADATISLECTSTLYSKLIPLPGWLGLILAGELEAGIGFELSGKVTLFNAGVELSSETTAQVELGMECAFGECNMIKKLTTVKNENKVSWKVPNLGQLRVEPSLFGFGYVKAKLGATLLKSLRIEALGAKAGVKYEASLAPAFVQVQPTPAPDPDYQSSYKLAALLEISAGKKINNLLTNLGIVKFNALKFSSSFPLGQSPKATGMTVDRDSFAPGETLNFKVALYPDTATFPLLGYNVAKIVIYRNRLGTVEEVASVTAAPNQTDFQIPWVANIGSAAGGNQFFAFVQTKLPSIVDLELGKLQVSECPRDTATRYCAVKLPARGIDLGDSDEVTLGLSGVWRDGSGTMITPPANADLFDAQQVNGLGQIAGFLFMKDGTTHGALLKNGVFTDFGSSNVTGVGQIMSLIDFNNKAQAVGDMQPTGVQDSACSTSFLQLGCTAYFFSDGNVRRFDGGGSGIHSVGIDNSGRAIVVNRIEGGKSYAWNGTTATPLDNVPCCNSFTAIGVSLSGVIVGEKRVGNETVAFVYPSTALSNQQSSAQAINDAGAVVGSNRNGSNRSATLWEGANQIDLNTITQPANLGLTEAYAINSHGTILAKGLGSFVLLPVDRIQEKIADLELSILAPASATPEGKLTYAVNLHNKSTRVVASNLRAEFFLPAGFTVTDIQGWSGCTTLGSAVTCTLTSLAAGERRAFLIDVQAPASVGEVIVSARVTATEGDPTPTDNFDTGATLLIAP